MKTTSAISAHTVPARRHARPRTGLLLVALLMATVVAGCRSATAPSPFGSCPSPSFSHAPAGTIGATVDSLVAMEVHAGHLPGMTIALAKQGTIIYAQAYGYADLSTCRPMQSATPFEIGSVTKTFTAAAALQLQSTGALDIDNPVIAYLPTYPFDQRITVRYLLNMASGLADYLNDTTDFPEYNTWVTSGVAQQTVLTAIAHAPLQETPGTQYQYSNSNYYVLGAIIEAISGQSYADYLATKITGPLALTRTSLVLQPPAAALPWDSPRQEGLVPNTSAGFAAGGLWSTVLDLASFDAALFGGRVVPAAQFTEMVTPPGSSPYGMGFTADDNTFGRPFVYHSGRFRDYLAFNGLFYDDGFSISYLTNGYPVNLASVAFGNLAVQVVNAICPDASPSCS